MRKQLTLTLGMLAFGLFLFTCKKDRLISNDKLPEEINIEMPQNVRTQYDGASQFIIAQNYLLRIINHSLTVALLTPQMHGIQGEPYVDTRTCPTVSGPFANTTDGSLDITIDFGTDCYFTNTIGGSPDTISGLITLKKFGGPITDTATNTFIEFDELKFNNQIIRFVPGSVSGTDRIKFKFFSGAGATFNYNAFIDGAFGVNVFDRTHFQIVNCTTNDSLALYPSYSGIPAFNFEYIDPHGTAPVFNYDSLVHACYEININPMKAFYYDSENVLQEDYNITKVTGEPLIFKPLCKWLLGGKLEYDDIPMSDPNFTNMIDNPFLKLDYGSDEFGNQNDNCDRFILVTSCEEFLVEDCILGADTMIVACPL